MTDHTERLAELADRYRSARTELDDARDALTGEIRAAMGDGMRQSDVLRATGHVWTREMLRRLAVAE